MTAKRKRSKKNGEMTQPRERKCHYFLLRGDTKTLLGEATIPEGKDMDDAFPEFHTKNFSDEHYSYLVSCIKKGARLIAESDYDGKQSWLLAYIDDNPDYWYGRESTLKYLGIQQFRHAC